MNRFTDYRTQELERLNRETWEHNNIGNHHHHSNTGIKHPVNFNDKNEKLWASHNRISVADIYQSKYNW